MRHVPAFVVPSARWVSLVASTVQQCDIIDSQRLRVKGVSCHVRSWSRTSYLLVHYYIIELGKASFLQPHRRESSILASFPPISQYTRLQGVLLAPSIAISSCERLCQPTGFDFCSSLDTSRSSLSGKLHSSRRCQIHWKDS